MTDSPHADDPSETAGPGLQRSDAGAPGPQPIEPAAPEAFGRTQVWWGDGKGKTTAAMGMGFRAAGHGFRVHMLQFMKGGAESVEDVRGEYNAIAAMAGFTYEHTGHYGWHRGREDAAADEHAAKAAAALERVRELLASCRRADLEGPIPLDADPTAGVHLLILDEIGYAVNRDLIDPESVVEVIESKPDALELVLTGGHDEPQFVAEHADLISEVRKERHPFDDGQGSRRGTEY